MDLYHVLNRGVDGRDIFLNTSDYARFIHNLYEFNDEKPAGNAYRRFSPSKPMMDLRSPSFRKLVDIHAWCLMKNHYHLLLSERVDGGITAFIRKLNIGYAKFFNKKHSRKGTLFQGLTKNFLLDSEPHFLYIFHYIHLNPLDYVPKAKDWRIRSKEHGITDVKAAIEYLEKYRWSSYLDYCGTKNFPSILTTDFFRETFPDYKKEIMAYLRSAEEKETPVFQLE